MLVTMLPTYAFAWDDDDDENQSIEKIVDLDLDELYEAAQAEDLLDEDGSFPLQDLFGDRLGFNTYEARGETLYLKQIDLLDGDEEPVYTMDMKDFMEEDTDDVLVTIYDDVDDAIVEPPLEELPVEEPVIEEPSVEDPAIEESPVEEPPTEELPIEEPDAEEDPAEEPKQEDDAPAQIEIPVYTAPDGGEVDPEDENAVLAATLTYEEAEIFFVRATYVDEASLTAYVNGDQDGNLMEDETFDMMSYEMPRYTAVGSDPEFIKEAERMSDNTWKVTLSVDSSDTTVAGDPYHIVLVVDTSSSMNKTRMRNAKSAMTGLVDALYQGDVAAEIGIVEFDKAIHNTFALTDLASGYEDILDAIDAIRVSDDTNVEAGLIQAKAMLEGESKPVIIVLSDGAPTRSYWTDEEGDLSKVSVTSDWRSYRVSVKDPVSEDTDILRTDTLGNGNNDTFSCYVNGANRTTKILNSTMALRYATKKLDGITVHTVSCGSADVEFMKNLAVNGGSSFNASDDEGLSTEFEKIATILKSQVADARVIDPMGEHFTVDKDSIDVTKGGSYNQTTVENNTITWEFEKGPASLSYTVRLDTSNLESLFEEGTEGVLAIPTNGDTSIAYTNQITDKDEIGEFEVPNATFGIAKLLVQEQMLDADQAETVMGYPQYQLIRMGGDTATFDNIPNPNETYDVQILVDGEPATESQQAEILSGRYAAAAGETVITYVYSNKAPIGYGVTYSWGTVEPQDATPPTDETLYVAGAEVTVLPSGLTHANGSTFVGWTMDKEGEGRVYVAGDTFEITENTTLYAKWLEGNWVPAKYFILSPNLQAPTDGSGQGKQNYYPNDQDHGGVSGSDGETGYKGGYISPEAAEKLKKGQILDLAGVSEAYLYIPKDLGYFNTDGKYDGIMPPAVENAIHEIGGEKNIKIIWYVIKREDGIHVDGYLSGVPIEVVYHSNFGNPEQTETVALKSGDSHTILGYDGTTLPDRPGYKFKGWAETQNGAVSKTYTEGSTHTLKTSMALYAKWDPYTVTIQYKDAAGNSIQADTVLKPGTGTYDVSGQIQDTITTADGKVYHKNAVTGDAVSGSLDSNKVITVTYTEVKAPVVVQYVLDTAPGTPIDGMGATISDVSHGTAWAIAKGETENLLDPSALQAAPSIQVNGKNYTFDSIPTASGTVNGPTTITVVYSLDEKGKDKEPDGTPDKYQAFVEYVSADTEMGTVTGKTFEAFDLRQSGTDVLKTEITVSGSAATANTGYDFGYWSKPNSTTQIGQSSFANETLTGVEGGKTYVFTAHFAPKSYTVSYQFKSGTDGAALPGTLPVAPENTTVTYPETTHAVDTTQYGPVEETVESKQYVWTFDGWFTDAEMTHPAGQTIAVSGSTTLFGKWTRAEKNKVAITVQYQDEYQNELQANYETAIYTGADYSYTVGKEPVPFTLSKDGTQYVLDSIRGSLTGTDVIEPVTIVLTYAVDENKNGVPDKYDATITYKVVGGTWDGTDAADKQSVIPFREFNPETNTWVDTNSTLGETVPTGMQANEAFEGGAWDTTPTADTRVTGDATYIYTFTEKTYGVTYTFEGDVPADVTEPTDDGEYAAGATVKVDGKFTSATTITGMKNDKYGTYTFSGWKLHDEAVTNTAVMVSGGLAFTGTWTFKEETVDAADILARFQKQVTVNGLAPKFPQTFHFALTGDGLETVTAEATVTEAGTAVKLTSESKAKLAQGVAYTLTETDVLGAGWTKADAKTFTISVGAGGEVTLDLTDTVFVNVYTAWPTINDAAGAYKKTVVVPIDGMTFPSTQFTFLLEQQTGEDEWTTVLDGAADPYSKLATVAATQAVSDLTIYGTDTVLEAGTYRLTENELDANWTVNEQSFTFMVNADGTITHTAAEADRVFVNTYLKSNVSVEKTIKAINSIPVNAQTGNTAAVGDEITFEIVITNNGNKATTVKVADALDGAEVTGADDLNAVAVPANGSVTLTAVYTVKEMDTAVVNTVMVTNNDDPDNTDKDTTEPIPVLHVTHAQKNVLTAMPDMDVNWVGGTAPEITYWPVDGTITAPKGTEVTVLYAVTVTGDAGAKFQITDAGAAFVGTTTHVIDQNGTFIGTLPETQAAELYFTKTATAADETVIVRNTAIVNGEEAPAEEIPVVKPDDVTVTVKYVNEAGVSLGTDFVQKIAQGAAYDYTNDKTVVPDSITADSKIYVKMGADKALSGTANEPVVITVTYGLDEKGGGEDGKTPDGIPDSQQIIVYYTAENSYGRVTPSFAKWNYTAAEKGESKHITLTATAEVTVSRGRFDGWSNDFASMTKGQDGTLNVEVTGIVGSTYTVTADFYRRSGGNSGNNDNDDDDDDDDGDDNTTIIDEEVPLADTPWLNTTDHYAYIVGYAEDGTVRPGANINRAEVATIFFRLLTDEARDQFWSTSNEFSDVSADAWYNNAISTMVNAGIIKGYEDGTFRPNANITRAEFAAIAARFLSNPFVGDEKFTDTLNHWAHDSINDAAAAGWISGYADGTFRPDNDITRAEAVTLVNNVLQRAPHADHLLADMKTWPDNMDQSAWYYLAIQEATNSHDHEWSTDATYEIWTAMQATRDWAALEKDWAAAHVSGGEVMNGPSI